MLKGEIEIVVRDSETLEVVNRIVQPNIVTNRMFAELVGNSGNSHVKAVIVAISMPMAPSRTNTFLPGNLNGNTAVIGANIPGNAMPEFFVRNDNTIGGPTPAFAQWSTRLPLPAVTRTISTVALTNVLGQYHLDQQWIYGFLYDHCFAYSKLATPCFQTPTQFFDIYYRIFYPLTNEHDMPYWMYESMTRRLSGQSESMWQNNNGDYRVFAHTTSSPIPVVTPNSGDEEICWPSWTGAPLSSQWGFLDGVGTGGFYRRKYVQNFVLESYNGRMMTALHFSTGNGRAITSSSSINIGTKIQNLLGHRANSTLPFLDVSNFQQGTGSLTLGGEWENRSTPVVPGMYAPGKFSQMYFINIKSDGGVGTATYTFHTRPFFGIFSHPSFPPYYGTWRQPVAALSYLSQSQQASLLSDPELGQNLLGDLSKMGVRQLTSWCKYDDTSVVVVKQDMIMVYNIATGKYWRYFAGYNNITQVAVIGSKIYVGCRNTGLWVIDPPASNDVVSLATVEPGIDLSSAFGVAKGYNNNLWVVAGNCLARFDGTTWTKYDSTTPIPCNSPGITDGNWGNVEYLVADTESINNELMMVRQYNATVNPWSLGVWWSTVGSATTIGAEGSSNGQPGAPRVNRTHVNGKAGIWLVYASGPGRYYRLNFGSPNVNGTGYYNQFVSNANFTSINFVKNSANDWRWINLASQVTQESQNGNNYWGYFNVKMINASMITDSEIVSSMRWYWNSSELSLVASSNLPGYSSGNADMATNFELAPGVMFFAAYRTNGVFNSFIGVYPFDLNAAGGGMAYLGQTNYGWNGSQWTTAVTTPKTIHTAIEPLVDGVTVGFSNGVGTSFVNGDWYNFVTCEGLMKDTATTGAFEYSFYYKRAYRDQTLLQVNTIPGQIPLATGTVLLDLDRSSSAVEIVQDANQFVFLQGNPQQFAVGDKQVTGDFSISYTPIAGPTSSNIAFGIGAAAHGQILYGFVISNGSIFVCDTPNGDKGIFAFPALRGSFGTFSTASDLSIRRVSGVLQFWVNGVLRWSVTPPLGQIRFDLICSPFNNWDPANWVPNRRCPMTTIVSNGTDNSVKIGRAINNSGAYNPMFYAIDSDTRNTNFVSIGGVPAIAYRYDGTPPGASEVGIDIHMGTLHFNPADEGKTVSAVYTYMTHE